MEEKTKFAKSGEKNNFLFVLPMVILIFINKINKI